MMNPSLATLLFLGSMSIGHYAAAAPTNAQCKSRANDTPAKLLECISKQEMWRFLQAFQQIADNNPDAAGHGNRNTGTAGYKQSVDYVADLTRRAGYKVTIQPYHWRHVQLTGTPTFTFPQARTAYAQDWYVARNSGAGTMTARVQPAGDGCAPDAFAAFASGHIALLQGGACAFDTAVSNATQAGAAAVILYHSNGARHDNGGAYEAKLRDAASIPVIGVASHAVGAALLAQYNAGQAPMAQIGVQMQAVSGIDYNLIADSPYGDTKHVVVVDAHLDAIYGAGMLDNASGSATILEIALKLARTPTVNQLRYIWFGGEELGLLGSNYYTKALRPAELRRIVFDHDVDVTATPNFAIQIADPAYAFNVKRFPPDVVPDSVVGNRYYADYFNSIGVVSEPARGFGNSGTDSNSFSLVGVPNTGILTEQDCCKSARQVKNWGGFQGNYEGNIPSFDGGCVDRPQRWCDNLSNNDSFVLWLVSKASAYTTFKLAMNGSLGR